MIDNAQDEIRTILHEISEIRKIHNSDSISTEKSLELQSFKIRNLHIDEINILCRNANKCDNWNNVFVWQKNDHLVHIERIERCSFEGSIAVIGNQFDGPKVNCGNNLFLSPGLFDTTFAGVCILHENCVVKRNDIISNIIISNFASVIGCGFVSGGNLDEIPYGIGTEMNVGPSAAGGRTVVLSPDIAYDKLCEAVLSHGQILPSSIQSYDIVKTSEPKFTVIGTYSNISHCPLIHNTYIANYCVLQNSIIHSCTLLSEGKYGASIVSGSQVKRCILHHDSIISENALVDSCLLYDHASVSGAARVSESVLAPDSSVGGGECAHSLLGPLVGFHHASLLIAAVWPHGRGNLSYGCMVGANHTGRVSDQECIIGEGSFFGLGVKIKFPFNCLDAPYTLYASGVTCLPQKIGFPFSLVMCPSETSPNIPPAWNVLKPAWVLTSNPYMLER
jgi:hypothetical protein